LILKESTEVASNYYRSLVFGLSNFYNWSNVYEVGILDQRLTKGQKRNLNNKEHKTFYLPFKLFHTIINLDNELKK
jgi:hypothetical protein